MTNNTELESINTSEHEASVEVRSGEQIISQSIDDIAAVESRVTTELGISSGTAEAVRMTDEALVDIANHELSSDDFTPAERRDAVEDIVIESAIEMAHGATPDKTALAMFTVTKHPGDISEVVDKLNESHATLPSGHEAGPLVMKAIDELSNHPVMAGEPLVVELTQQVDEETALKQALYRRLMSKKEQGYALDSYFYNINIDLLDANEPIEPTEAARLLETEHSVKNAPRLADQLKDTDRSNKIIYLHGKEVAGLTGTSEESERSSRKEISEQDALRDLDNFLKLVVDTTPAGYSSMAYAEAEALRESLTYIGEKEYKEATLGIATYWKAELDKNPDLQIFAIAGEIGKTEAATRSTKEVLIKSDDYMLENILSNFSDDELEQYGGRLIIDVEDITATRPQDLKVVLIDDWTISGNQLNNTATQFVNAHTEFEESVEVQLIAANETKIKHGMNLYRTNGAKYTMPLRAYYKAHSSEMGEKSGAHITGSHSSVDYDFELNIGMMVSELKYGRGQDVAMVAPTNIVRPYRYDGVTHSSLVKTEQLKQLSARRREASDIEGGE